MRLLLVLIVVLVVLLIVTLAVRSGGEPAMSAPTVTVAPVIDPGSTSASPTPSTSPTSVPSLTEGAFTDPPASAEVSTPSAPVRRSPAANGREPGKRYEGSVAVDRYYKDLDLDPPDRRDDNDGADVVYTFQGPLEAVGSSTVAFWLHKGLPGYADCVAVAAAGGLQEADVENGDVVCFRTDEGRVGRLEVIDAGTDAAHFNAVVWELE